ncbi:hypothetical protein [Methanobrevibacter curvatus]|uniref:Uncharacterized protein n=1 Tax=Methanobrevibacter curvatus TaxID=49547 RepID=A0A162FHQ1_9EURY|nr:hypothetical protein [Methanobrevibacter curvatus]KZX10120.1 hypothetical protein MBCUR_19170 [Methanobrevibacter curvatus]
MPNVQISENTYKKVKNITIENGTTDNEVINNFLEEKIDECNTLDCEKLMEELNTLDKEIDDGKGIVLDVDKLEERYL